MMNQHTVSKLNDECSNIVSTKPQIKSSTKSGQIKKYREEYGFSLIPNQPKTKQPEFGKGEYTPYFDKVCNKEIRPDNNVGVMLGKPSKNLVAFDDDTYKETFLDMFPEYRNKTFTTKSGKKGGAVFFRLDELPKFNYATIKKEGKEIEVFTRNRQIILPPSIHPDTGNQYEVKNDSLVLKLTKEQFLEIFTKFEENGWAVSFGDDKKLSPVAIQNKNVIVHEGNNRSLFLLRQIDSWKIKNPEFDEIMLYGLATNWNQTRCEPPYPDNKIQGLVKQGYEFGTSKITENNSEEPIDESVRIEREKSETPLQQITRHANTIIKEDPKLVDQLLRVCLSTYTDNPINIALLAPSSDGKTYATVKITELFPKEDVIVVGRMSPTALIHQQGELIDKDGEPLQERLNAIDVQITDTKDKDKIKNLKEQKQKLLSSARNCIDLKNKILLFLDNPTPATYEMLKPIMSHDKKEIIYKTTKGDGSLSVKETVIRNWCVFIFCSAKNEDRNEVWEEIKTRVLMTSPESTVKKYKEANRFTALKMGLPSWGSGVYHSNEDEKWAKWYIADYKKKLNDLCSDGNPVLNTFNAIMSNIFPNSQGDHMRHFARLCSFVNLETMLNADHRPIYELEIDDLQHITVITTIDDVDQACKTLGDIGSLPPEKMKFYNQVFCPLFDKKTLGDSSTIDGTWLTSSELAEEYTTKLGKTTDNKKIQENYLKPLTDAGVLEVSKNPAMMQQNLYRKVGTISTCNISDLKSKIIEDPKTVELGVRSCLESLVRSSTKNQKYNEKITIDNQRITTQQLINIISNKLSKTREDKS